MSDKDKDKNVVEQLLVSVITSSDSNIGPIALSAKQHGEDLLAVNYADGLSSQIEVMQSIIDNANDALEYVRKQRESLPGNQLDAVSSAAIRIADVGATVLLPFLVKQLFVVTGQSVAGIHQSRIEHT